MLKIKTSQGVLSITTEHSGKMAGMWSISTSPLINQFCKAHREVENSICKKCFSVRQLGFRKTQEKPYLENMETLRNIIPVEELPFLNCLYFRIEAFGDIENTNQAINYLNLIAKNPHCNFAWFTKNPLVLIDALHKLGYTKEKGKPQNLTIVLSSLYENKQTTSEFWFVDKIFTVYDKKTIKENNIQINCGAKSCLGCRLCYDKNNVSIVNEMEK